MNYHRQPINWKLGIEREYTVDELVELTQYIVKTNQYQFELTGDTISPVHIPYSKRTSLPKRKKPMAALQNNIRILNTNIEVLNLPYTAFH